MRSSTPKLPGSLSEVAVAFLEKRGARFDLEARAEPEKLRGALAKLKVAPWPALLELEREFGGLRFADWLLGPFAVITEAPKLRNTKSSPVALVCVGVNDTGRLFADEAGQIWDEDMAAGSLRLRADSMERRLEREAYAFRIGVLGQRCFKVLPSSVSAAAGAKRLKLRLIGKASDQFERVWQSDTLTVWKSTDDVRVFAKTEVALKKAVASLARS